MGIVKYIRSPPQEAPLQYYCLLHCLHADILLPLPAPVLQPPLGDLPVQLTDLLALTLAVRLHVADHLGLK